jgi:peptide/nickel transport system permease protein
LTAAIDATSPTFLGESAGCAPELPEILPEIRHRGGVWGYCVRHPTIAIGGVLLTVIVLIAVFAPHLCTVDPNAIAPAKRTREPSAAFWFGTDMLGRDIYSRVLYGTRVSLIVGFAVALLSSLIGLAIGTVSGFSRRLDNVVMRIMDGLMSIPPVLLAIALLALTRGSVANVVLAITVADAPRVARLVRGVVLSLREQPFIDGAIASGTRVPMIIFRHILPNTISPLIVQATYICASAMITEAILSFLGVGTPPSTPSWGNIMADGRAVWQVKFYIVLFPAIFLSLTVLAINLIGDGLRDALDPRMAKNI